MIITKEIVMGVAKERLEYPKWKDERLEFLWADPIAHLKNRTAFFQINPDDKLLEQINKFPYRVKKEVFIKT